MEYSETHIAVLTSPLTAPDESKFVCIGLKLSPQTGPWHVVLQSMRDAAGLNERHDTLSVTPTLTCEAYTQMFPKAFQDPRAQALRSPYLQQWLHVNASYLYLGNPMLYSQIWCTIRFHFISHLWQVRHESSNWSPWCCRNWSLWLDGVTSISIVRSPVQQRWQRAPNFRP